MKCFGKIVCIAVSLACLSLSECSPKAHQGYAGNYRFTTECLGVEFDGSQTLKTWGSGRNRADALEQAKKNAVRTVLFKGITDGLPDCQARPIIGEVNAEVRYQDYFNSFFADGGDYKHYISSKDESLAARMSRDGYTGSESVVYGLIVRILRADLEMKMIADGILK